MQKKPPIIQTLGVIDPESLASLLKRPWDPLGGLFVHHRLRKIPANPIILMAPDAPSNLTCATSVKRKKFWHNQLSSLGKVIPINSGVHPSSSGAHTGAAAQSLENMINAMRAKVLWIECSFCTSLFVTVMFACCFRSLLALDKLLSSPARLFTLFLPSPFLSPLPPLPLLFSSSSPPPSFRLIIFSLCLPLEVNQTFDQLPTLNFCLFLICHRCFLQVSIVHVA